MELTGSKGQGLVLSLMVLAGVILTGAWIQSQATAGTVQRQDVLATEQADSVQLALENAVMFMETSLGISASRASSTTANRSGRTQTAKQYRYWLCNGETQIPEIDDVRAASSFYASQDMQRRLNALHGIRNNYIYRVGDQRCIETGYRTPMNNPKNDNFLSAARYSGLNLTTGNGSINKGQNNFSLKDRVQENRFWYMYNVSKTWVKDAEERLKENITEELKELPDQVEVFQRQCVPSRSDATCPSDDPQWRSGQGAQIEAKITQGIQYELQRLENGEKYFNDNNVRCNVEFNEKDGNSYPGYRTIIERRSDCNFENLGGCGTCLEYENPCECSSTSTASGSCTRNGKLQYPYVCSSTTQKIDGQPTGPPSPPPDDGGGGGGGGGGGSGSGSGDGEGEGEGEGFCASGETCNASEFNATCDSVCGPSRQCVDGCVVVTNCPGDCTGGACEACGENCLNWTKEQWKTSRTFEYRWDAWADIEVTCTDHEYKSVPQDEELGRVTWRFDLSFSVSEDDISNSISCSSTSCEEIQREKPPTELQTCEITGSEATLDVAAPTTTGCQTGVRTIEETR